ncbi:HAD family hydrolase [Planosporangium mesophilum]|uniref:HAD family hydrolase n=1 Tax=Planosporangium mesophilum TaxID=689768 RepID=UPI001438D3E1|nr:HAD family hydrolase [Planosporangium mesophilum]NJC83348.1 HAD family hydrolase [Planosporangium mesophilum]
MPLLLLSLDNTLIDRDGAFRAWGQDFLERVGAPEYDLDWLLSVDADGMTPAWDLADAIQTRYRLHVSSLDLVEIVREGLLERLRLDPLVACALGIAEDAGWVPVVVTNGETRLQEEKLRRTGLDRYLAAWVISEEAGCSKPNPRIFGIAAERARVRLRGAWLIGDVPEADIAGADAIGVPSIWLHRGRDWPESRFAPTRTVDTAIEALAVLMGAT